MIERREFAARTCVGTISAIPFVGRGTDHGFSSILGLEGLLSDLELVLVADLTKI